MAETDARKSLHFCVIRGLLEGFGVEDIAVMHGFDVADVRAKVRSLRNDGYLFGVVRNARKKRMAIK
jgi:hypothetical protein